MEIKKLNIRTLATIMSAIKINKFDDKEAKLAFIHNHLSLRKLSNEIQADQDEIVKKFRDDWGDEIKEVYSLRQENKEIVGHDDFLKAEKEADEFIANLMDESVEVDIKPVSLDKFLSAFTDEDITLEYIAFLTDNGILE